MDVALLAKCSPNVPVICGHSTSGDWELGVRVIRPYENVLLKLPRAILIPVQWLTL